MLYLIIVFIPVFVFLVHSLVCHRLITCCSAFMLVCASSYKTVIIYRTYLHFGPPPPLTHWRLFWSRSVNQTPPVEGRWTETSQLPDWAFLQLIWAAHAGRGWSCSFSFSSASSFQIQMQNIVVYKRELWQQQLIKACLHCCNVA